MRTNTYTVEESYTNGGGFNVYKNESFLSRKLGGFDADKVLCSESKYSKLVFPSLLMLLVIIPFSISVSEGSIVGAVLFGVIAIPGVIIAAWVLGTLFFTWIIDSTIGFERFKDKPTYTLDGKRKYYCYRSDVEMLLNHSETEQDMISLIEISDSISEDEFKDVFEVLHAQLKDIEDSSVEDLEKRAYAVMVVDGIKAKYDV